MWRDQAKASRGVELIAETGVLDELQSELAIEGSVLDHIEAFGIEEAFDGATSISKRHLCVDTDHPFVSGIGMIAPSPDWFSGVYNLPLWNRETQTWYKTVEVDVYPWDAGTEQGKDYNLSNPDTIPHGAISAFMPGDTEKRVFVSVGQAGLPFLQVKPVGVLRFELQESSKKCA